MPSEGTVDTPISEFQRIRIRRIPGAFRAHNRRNPDEVYAGTFADVMTSLAKRMADSGAAEWLIIPIRGDDTGDLT